MTLLEAYNQVYLIEKQNQINSNAKVIVKKTFSFFPNSFESFVKNISNANSDFMEIFYNGKEIKTSRIERITKAFFSVTKVLFSIGGGIIYMIYKFIDYIFGFFGSLIEWILQDEEQDKINKVKSGFERMKTAVVSLFDKSPKMTGGILIFISSLFYIFFTFFSLKSENKSIDVFIDGLINVFKNFFSNIFGTIKKSFKSMINGDLIQAFGTVISGIGDIIMQSFSSSKDLLTTFWNTFKISPVFGLASLCFSIGIICLFLPTGSKTDVENKLKKNKSTI